MPRAASRPLSRRSCQTLDAMANISSSVLRTLDAVAKSFTSSNAGDIFLCFQEGYTKTRLLECFLQHGHSALEGSNRKGLAWQVLPSTTAGHGPCLTPWVNPFPGYKPDLRIQTAGNPILNIELKSRPTFGSREQANWQYYINDLAKVQGGPAHAFLFVATSETMVKFVSMVGLRIQPPLSQSTLSVGRSRVLPSPYNPLKLRLYQFKTLCVALCHK